MQSNSCGDADALIAVTPIFSASYSGLFMSFFDALDDAVPDGKPVLLGATAGTPRHSPAIEFAMRPLLAYFKAEVVPTAVFAAIEDFGSTASGNLADRSIGPGWSLRTGSMAAQCHRRRSNSPTVDAQIAIRSLIRYRTGHKPRALSH